PHDAGDRDDHFATGTGLDGHEVAADLDAAVEAFGRARGADAHDVVLARDQHVAEPATLRTARPARGRPFDHLDLHGHAAFEVPVAPTEVAPHRDRVGAALVDRAREPLGAGLHRHAVARVHAVGEPVGEAPVAPPLLGRVERRLLLIGAPLRAQL